jgi:hypothetical protein
MVSMSRGSGCNQLDCALVIVEGPPGILTDVLFTGDVVYEDFSLSRCNRIEHATLGIANLILVS